MNLKRILEELITLLNSNGISVVAADHAKLNEGDEILEVQPKAILSVINIEEDKKLRNPKYFFDENNKYKLPKRCFFISLLFTLYSEKNSTYLEGIESLQKVLNYFHENNSLFYNTNNSKITSYADYDVRNESENEVYSKLLFTQENLSLDQINVLSCVLGTRPLPYLLYKMRVE